MDRDIVLIYDIRSCPEGLNIDNINNILTNSGIVVYDSTFGGKEPIIVNSESLRVFDVKFFTEKEIRDKFGEND